MKAAEKTEKKERRLGVRMGTEAFDRLELALPGLKQRARAHGKKLTQQTFVDEAIAFYLDFMEHTGDETTLAAVEIMTIGTEKQRRALKSVVTEILADARASEERRTKQVG